MSLKLNSSGGGSVTLQEPSTASTRTLTLPDNTGTVVSTASTGVVTPTMLSTGAPSWDSSGNVLVGTSSTPTSMTNSVVAQSTAKAWIRLTDNGSTVTTNASFNISSVTRVGTGNYTLNFTAALSSSSYCVVGAGGCNSTSMRAVSLPYNSTSPTTTSTPIQLVAADGVLGSATQYLCAAILSASY